MNVCGPVAIKSHPRNADTPADADNPVEGFLKLKMIPSQEANLGKQQEAAFVDIWDACSPLLQAKLKSLTNWQQINQDKNAIQLGLQIKAIAQGLEQQQEPIFGHSYINHQ